jgi:hypothetical protein
VAYVQGNEETAQAEQTRILNAINTGDYIEPSKQTVPAYFDRWLEHIENQVSAKTFERYREIVRTHQTDAFGMIPLAKLTAAGIDAACARWQKSGRRRKGKDATSGGLSPRPSFIIIAFFERRSIRP